MKGRGGIGGAIAAFLLFCAKWAGALFALLGKIKIFLILGKLFLTFGSMFLSMWAYVSFYHVGWPFAFVFIFSIFFHECGHAIAGKSRGLPISNMVFIPLMGAAVMLKRGGRSVGEDAFIGIMGPVFGALYALGCLGIGLVMHSPFWMILAFYVAFMNLFNLIPMAPLDGGWIVPVFSPKVLAVGAAIMIPVAIWAHNPFILILGLLSLPRIIAGWKAKAGESEYFNATPADRIIYGIAYPGLAIFLSAIMYGANHFFALARGMQLI